MNEVTIRIISNIFIISSLVFFVGAVILVILKHKEKVSHVVSYNLKQKRDTLPKNKRTHERIGYSKEIKFSHPEVPYEEGIAMGGDISPQGVGLLAPVNVKIKVGTKIELEFFFEDEDRAIRIEGKVVWAEGLEHEEMEKLSLISEFFARRVGIRFVGPDEENRQKIQILIKDLLEKKKGSEGDV